MRFAAFLDNYVAVKILALRGNWGMELFGKITMLGNWQVVLFSTILVAIYIIFVEKRKDLLFSFLASIGGCSFSTAFVKELVKRQRPFGISEILGYSFPSGHTSHVVCLYGFVLFLLLRTSEKFSYKMGSSVLWLGVVVLVGFSRLYLGVHYLSDVLAGALLGIFWLLIGTSLVIKQDKKLKSTAGSIFVEGEPIRATFRLVPLLFLSWLVLYLIVIFCITPEHA